MVNTQVGVLTDEILKDALVLSLGTVDEDGVWVSDVVFIHDSDYTLYWRSLTESRHSRALTNNPRVACTIHASVELDCERALQIAGVAERIDGERPDLLERLVGKVGARQSGSPEALVDTRKVWYKLTPTRIELICNQHFGFIRQRVL